MLHFFNIVLSIILTKSKTNLDDECAVFLISFFIDSSIGIVFTLLLQALANHSFNKKKQYRMVQGNYVKNSGRIDFEAFAGQTIVWNINVLLVNSKVKTVNLRFFLCFY